MTVEIIWVNSRSCSRNQLRQFELCDVAKGSYQKMDTVSNNTQAGWAVRTQGAEKIFCIPLHHHYTSTSLNSSSGEPRCFKACVSCFSWQNEWLSESSYFLFFSGMCGKISSFWNTPTILSPMAHSKSLKFLPQSGARCELHQVCRY